jgi:hypothetical protein
LLQSKMNLAISITGNSKAKQTSNILRLCNIEGK